MADYERTPRVLVVEDDDAIAQVLQRSLRMEGYEVRIAGDGVDALDEAHAFLPDLVILDLGLPRLDGVDVAKTLRRTGDDVPILVLTARDGVEARVEGLTPAPTTTWSSRSSARSCWPGCARCSGAGPRAARRCWPSATSS
jgi:CheY-like chemotaxis protein